MLGSKLFDAARERASFDEFTRSYLVDGTWHVTEAKGNVGRNTLEMVVPALLVAGMSAMGPVLATCERLLDEQLAVGAGTGSEAAFNQSRYWHGKALCRWLRDSDPAVATWQQASAQHALALAPEVYGLRDVATKGLDEQMAYCVLAHDYQGGIAHFERHHGPKALSVKKALKPREFAYLWCRHRLAPQFSDQEVHDAGRRMLRANLQGSWLGYGQAVRAATWLMIVHWCNDPSLAPLDALLLAYDDMPDVARPAIAG